MATRAEIKQAMVSRVIQEGLIDPATGQPMSAMDSVLEAVTDGIVMVEGGGPHSSTHVTGGTDVIPDAVPGGASGLMSGADKAKLNGIEAGAQVNQNAFSYVKVGATTIGADSTTDTLELAAGTNIVLTPDAINGKVTIAVTGTVSSAQDSDTVDGKHASDLALVGHGHTGGSDGNQVGTSGLQDGAVTDAKIGNRTVDQTQAPTGSTGTLTQLLSWLANRIKAMAGATNWFDNPAASLASIWAKFNAGTGHKHTGAADDAPQVDYASIANKPLSFAPSAHKASHEAGGSDPISNLPSGAQVASNTIWHAGNDGSGSGLDADTVDTKHASDFAPASHVGAGGSAHAAATTSTAGFMSASDKTKLDGIAVGAEPNQNAFASLKAVDSGGTSKGQVDADAKTDILTLKEGTGISLSVDAGTDTITIAATGGGLPAAHATTHITGGTDVIPNAIAGGASGLMSGADKQKLDGIQAGAEVNQNAFANVLVGGTTIAADSKTDTLELVAGTNIALTPDATNDKVTIAVTGTVASASNADTVDGYHAGNSSGQVALSNGTVCTSLNADTVDGRHASEIIPSGVIVMWSGAADAIPTGWALCDGTNGTPDLRDRFIVGAGGSYAVGSTGGAAQVTLTVNEIPSHDHSASTGSAGSHSHEGATSSTGSHTHSVLRTSWANFGVSSSNRYYGLQVGGTTQSGEVLSAGDHAHTISSDGTHTHSVTVSTTGGGAAHENRPPYYALCFIMKL